MIYIFKYLLVPIGRFIMFLIYSLAQLIGMLAYILWCFKLPKLEWFELYTGNNITNRVIYYKSPIHYLLGKQTVEVKIIGRASYGSSESTSSILTDQIATIKVTCDRKYVLERNIWEHDVVYQDIK